MKTKNEAVYFWSHVYSSDAGGGWGWAGLMVCGAELSALQVCPWLCLVSCKSQPFNSTGSCQAKHCNVASRAGRQRKTILQVFVDRAFRLSYLEINLLAKGKLNQILFERKAAEWKGCMRAYLMLGRKTQQEAQEGQEERQFLWYGN